MILGYRIQGHTINEERKMQNVCQMLKHDKNQRFTHITISKI